MKKALEERLHSIEAELQSVMAELDLLRGKVRTRDKRERSERRLFEQERLEAEALVKVRHLLAGVMGTDTCFPFKCTHIMVKVVTTVDFRKFEPL